jgi:hypothetical protein
MFLSCFEMNQGFKNRWSGVHTPVMTVTFKFKVYHQDFFWVLIDLIVEILGLILKSFDNQTESWNPVSNDLIIRSFDKLIDNQREWHVITFTERLLTNQTKQTQTTVSTDWFLRFLLSVCSDPSSGVHKRSGHHHLRHQKPDHLRLYLLTF